MEPVSIALALVAGLLSTLSPCVLPLLPAILIGARGEHPHGPYALAAGLALSFTAMGLLLSTVGFALGLTADHVRLAGGIIMVALGAVLVVPAAQARMAAMAGPLQTWTEARFGRFSTTGLGGQFGLGLLLGAVWAPCVGPTLGAASLLAAQGTDLPMVGLVMLVFGIGAALPVVILASLSRLAAGRSAAAARRFAGPAKAILGLVLMVLGGMIMSGTDKLVEAALVEASPQWLTELTTRF